MSAAGILFTFLSGSAVGGLATAAFQASHQRAERWRDRMLDAAEAFLATVDAAERKIDEASLAQHDALSARRELWAEVAVSEKSLGTLPRPFLRMGELLSLVEDPADAAAFSTAVSEVRVELRSALESEHATEDQRVAAEKLLTGIARYARTGGKLISEHESLLAVGSEVLAQIARIRIVFAENNDRVTSQAVKVARIVSDDIRDTASQYAKAIREAEGGETQKDEPATVRVDRASEIQEFAERVSARVRRSRWHWW